MKDRFDRAEELRQGIIDFLRALPKSKTRAVANKFNISVEYAYEVMRVMVKAGEIAPHGKNNVRTWTALVDKTMSAHAQREAVKEGARNARMQEKLGVKKPKKSKVETRCEPWRLRSCDIRNPNVDIPIPNQGGQGAVRREFGIQASAGML